MVRELEDTTREAFQKQSRIRLQGNLYETFPLSNRPFNTRKLPIHLAIPGKTPDKHPSVNFTPIILTQHNEFSGNQKV